ncbi:MAG: hypothetical protein ACYC63_15010 [Armatimonadota bacterium]
MLRLSMLWIACVLCAGGMAMAAPESLMIADFEDPAVLDRITVTKSASVSLSDQDVVTGKRCLEVRVGPFSTHGDRWPYVFLIDKYFPTPLDLSPYSRVVASVRNVTDGLASVHMTLSTKPYNDGGRNLEGEYFAIPGGSTMECALTTSLFRNPINDPSSVQALMFVFPPNETNAVYRIDSVRAVYNPAVGSPAEKLAEELLTGAGGLLQQVRGLDRSVNWPAVPAERAATLRQRLPELEAALLALQQRAQVAASQGWKGQYNANRDAVEGLARSVGEIGLADKTGFHLWQRPRYTYVRRNAMPGLATPSVERLEVRMAQNEFRDASFMVTAADRDVELTARVTAREPGLAEAVQLRWSEFVAPKDRGEYADLLVPLEGALTIPQGESRELWATFDTRWHDVKPGQYDLQLRLRDRAGGKTQTVPVSLTVWPFALPSYDLLPNNAYVEFHNSEIGTHVPNEGVRHMKMYGVNMVYILPNELPWPMKVDDQFNLTGFEAKYLTERLTQMLTAWKAAPGQERLQWVFSLSGAPDRLLADKSVAFLSEQWLHVFEQWLTRFKGLVRSLGIADEDWMFVLADESSVSALTNYEIPFAEALKHLDPKLKLTCNASQVLEDKDLAARYFRVFDSLQPCLDSLKRSPQLRQFVGVNQRPLWTYRCQGLAGMDKNLYDYYRVYAWENLNYGIVGTGIWTYCAQGDGAWSPTGRSLSYNLVFKQRDKNELLHSRRYEFYREGSDDCRYVQALLAVSGEPGTKTERESRRLIDQATADILADVSDFSRAERWREQIAEQIIKLQDQR